MRVPPAIFLILIGVALAAPLCPSAHAQAALFLEDSDSLSEVLDPLGHESVYFARICAASLTQLRRCETGELGVVISRYHGIAGFDWLATPLIPFLYSVDSPSSVPAHIDRETVQSLRVKYHDSHFMSLGSVPEGGQFKRGWNQLVGAAYERRIYAFRFETTPQQDDAFIAKMNAGANRSRFSILFRNCANFAGTVLDFYFPGTFHRQIVPDGGLVTPRQIACQLVHYARKHTELQLTVFEIPLIPGMHHSSRVGKSAVETFIITGYVVPVVIVSPYAAGVIVADFLIWGRYPIPLRGTQVLTPQTASTLASARHMAQGPPGSPGQLSGSSAP
jgi:hypothetical protein